MPSLPETYAVWCGAIQPAEHFKNAYAVDDVRFTATLETYLDGILSLCTHHGNGALLLLQGLNTDSGKETQTTATFSWLDTSRAAWCNYTMLHPIAADTRVYKSDLELGLMRHVSSVTCMAHVEVMRSLKPGMTEYQLESLFQHHTYTHGGCRHVAYTCICACGPNAATLHYGHAGAPNERVLLESDIALLDMGAEYHCYW